MRAIKLILLLISVIIVCQTRGEKVSKQKAQKVATNWHENKIGRKTQNELLKTDYIISENDTNIFIFNFDNDGFVIVAGDDNTFPILAYNTQGVIDIKNASSSLLDWLAYYSFMVKSNKDIKSKSEKTKEKWDMIENSVLLKSTMVTVPSLFESTGSSRWAAWDPYFNAAPANPFGINRGTNGCVPLAMSQIMKYYEFPPLGTGSNSYTYNGLTISEDFNEFFNYKIMPFRLTYCANGLDNCTDSTWGIIPGITQGQIDAIGIFQYLIGVSVDMNWVASFDTSTFHGTGTGGTANDWVNAMVSNFYFDSDFTYWDNTSISSNPNDFKDDLRQSLDNGNPALFRYDARLNAGGHAIVIDGYEDDEFFHFCSGRGGHNDGYYFLFSNDDDGIHDPREGIAFAGLGCVVDIRPDCNIPTNLTLSNQDISSESSLNRASNSLTVSSVIIKNGAKAYFGANSVNITSNFEVEIGAEILINNNPCGNE